jgi:hypothetical protein
MASADGRTTAELRRAIETEREELTSAVADLRGSLGVTDKLREKLPVVAAGAVGLGFLLGGGIGATMRLLARRSREGDTKAKLGRFAVVERD